jgi:nitroimidazol reductase NimA-like FMN-containing flavoprotein (pyridoxamine 5'-phosphate oxidase superfamily)
MNAMSYHMRRTEREITSRKEMTDLLSGLPHVTFAMCKDGTPYLVTVNHAYDREANRIYFHCARSGKKLDFIKANPRVMGQVIEDRGYVKDECDYDYRTVHFEGVASEVTSSRERLRALALLVAKFEADTDEARKRFIKAASFKRVAVYRIDIDRMTGKMRVP